MPEVKSNCIGYAFSYLGILNPERKISMPSEFALMQYFKVVNPDSAQALAWVTEMLGTHAKMIIHMAIVLNPDQLIQRPQEDGPIEIVSRNSVINRYDLPLTTILHLARSC